MTKIRNAVVTFIQIGGAAALWLPLAAWIMPLVADAPTYEADPLWYWSSFAMGVVLTFAVRWAARKRSALSISKE